MIINNHSISPSNVVRGEGAWIKSLDLITKLCKRPLTRAVMRLLEDSLAEEVLSGRIKDGDKAEVYIDESKKVIVKHLGKDGSKPELASATV